MTQVSWMYRNIALFLCMGCMNPTPLLGHVGIEIDNSPLIQVVNDYLLFG